MIPKLFNCKFMTKNIFFFSFLFFFYHYYVTINNRIDSDKTVYLKFNIFLLLFIDKPYFKI